MKRDKYELILKIMMKIDKLEPQQKNYMIGYIDGVNLFNTATFRKRSEIINGK